jgi:WD40 repeat protein
VATGSHDHAVRIWDAADGTKLGVLSGHNAKVTALTALRGRDGRMLLATGSADNTVRVWDPATFSQKAMLSKPGVGMLSDISRRIGSAVAAIPEGTLLAVGCNAGPVRLYDYATGMEEAVLLGHRGVVTALVVFSGPRRRTLLATSAYDGTVRVWDPRARLRRERTVLSGHDGAVTALVSFTDPAGRPLLASGGRDGSLRLWDPVAGMEEAVLTGHTSITSIAVLRAADGRPLLATLGDKTVRIWDPDTRTCLAVLPVGMTGELAVTGSALVIGDYEDLVALELGLHQMGL